MIRPLRKYHFYAWRILATALPLLFIAAILLRPTSAEKYTSTDNDFSFSVRRLSNSSAQLTIELKNPLKVPSCLVYVSSGSKDILLGMIDRKGTYDFEFNGDEKIIRVRLYDAIRKREIMMTDVSTIND